MSKKPFTNNNTHRYIFNPEAPDLLLKKITELSATLTAAKENPNKNEKAIIFYSDILATMKYAWSYMIELQFVSKKLIILKSENDYLKEWANHLNTELTKYQVIEELKLTGDFDNVVASVDNYIQFANDLKNSNE